MKVFHKLDEAIKAIHEGDLSHLTIEHDGEELFIVFPPGNDPILRYVSGDPSWRDNVFVQAE